MKKLFLLLFIAALAACAGKQNIAIAEIEMVFVPGGSFIMGEEAAHAIGAQPEHQVTVSSFYIGKYELTQAEWVAIMGSNPSSLIGDDLPVDTINWHDAIKYCNLRSIKEGLTPVYRDSEGKIIMDILPDGPEHPAFVVMDAAANGYRLPTEAEWEYVAKRGNTDGNAEGYNLDVGWWEGGPYPVGTKPANDLGIHDMLGNVAEWCWDWYGDYPSSSQINPTGPASGKRPYSSDPSDINYRTFRGGGESWGYADSSDRFLRGAWLSGSDHMGMRIVRNAKE